MGLNWYSYRPESTEETLNFILKRKNDLFTVWLDKSHRVGYVQTSPMETVNQIT